MKLSQEEFINNGCIAIQIEDESLLEAILKWCDSNNIVYSEYDTCRFKEIFEGNNSVYFSIFNKIEVDFYDLVTDQEVYNMSDIEFLITENNSTNNTRSNIIILTAGGGVGKDTLLKTLTNEISIKPLISHTTRKPRQGEQEGVEYYFVKEEYFENKKFVETREYNTKHGLWKYGLSISEVLKACNSTGNYIAILDVEGKNNLIKFINEEQLDINIISIMLKCSYQQRLLRMLNREGSMDNEATSEVIRRFKADLIDIDSHMSEYDIVLTNETMEDLQRNVKIIKSLIEK